MDNKFVEFKSRPSYKVLGRKHKRYSWSETDAETENESSDCEFPSSMQALKTRQNLMPVKC